MNFSGLQKNFKKNLQEIEDCAVKFSVLDKINFDDLQEKRWRDEF